MIHSIHVNVHGDNSAELLAKGLNGDLRALSLLEGADVTHSTSSQMEEEVCQGAVARSNVGGSIEYNLLNMRKVTGALGTSR